MKKARYLIYFFLTIYILTIPLACARKSEEQPPKEQPKDTVEKVTFVGSNKCYDCHSGIKDQVAENSHSTAFKSLSSYNINITEDIKIYEEVKEKEPNSFDLKEAKIIGVMSDSYVIGAIKDKYYRIAAVNKTDGSWNLKPASAKDLNNDGKEDWVIKDYTCGDCHSPGLAKNISEKTDLEPGFGCESCHGPGSLHTTTKSKESIKSGKEACLNCHTASEPKVEGEILIAQNHYGTRNWFDSNHNKGNASDCLNCHTSHKVNAEGKMINKDSSQELCSSCHGDKVNVEEIMWKNPTDERNHFTKDHSFGKYPYEKLGDKPDTKPVEITNPEVINEMKKKLSK